MQPPTLDSLTPRASVFDPAIRDAVYSIDDLNSIKPEAFFAENYITQGMRVLLTEAFERLEGDNQHASGVFLLSQSMGGGKTHSLLALGLLAKYPELRQQVMGEFHKPKMIGSLPVVAFNGRETHTPLGLWGALAERLGKKSAFDDFYSPLSAPGMSDWVSLLAGGPVLILLDELPPYFENAAGHSIGTTTLAGITTVALANLFAAVAGGHLPQACVVLTDLGGSAYVGGSLAISASLSDAAREASRVATTITPVDLASDELYNILRTRLFEGLADPRAVEEVADGYSAAVSEARKLDQTTASAEALRAGIVQSYPFHPSIRDLFARFRENANYQQTRALLRIMRLVVAKMWQDGSAHHRSLIAAHDLNLHLPELRSEIRQINAGLENAIAHDIAASGASAVAEQIDGPANHDAADAATLLLLASLSQAIDPVLGLTRSELVAALATPGRDLSRLRAGLDELQRRAWYVHVTGTGLLLFRNTQNLNAKLESYAQATPGEIRESELAGRLKKMFAISQAGLYQRLEALPQLDQVELNADQVTLIIYRPTAIADQDVRSYFGAQQYRNRVLFLTGEPTAYSRVLDRSAYVRAISLIIEELKRDKYAEGSELMKQALDMQSTEASQFYLACREAFIRLLYPAKSGLTPLEITFQYTANQWKGEEQVVQALEGVAKYQPNLTENPAQFRDLVYNRGLWPANSSTAHWPDVKRAAATETGWPWHHPNALDDLRATMLLQDEWRDAGNGFLQRGPFPPEPASLNVQLLSRDSTTGRARLRIRPLRADRVHMAVGMSVALDSPLIAEWEFETGEVTLSFLAEDSKGQHQPGEPVTWTNTIDVKYRFYQNGSERMCELRALPRGVIRYTTDGQNPQVAGSIYVEPFAVPPGSTLVLARAVADGVESTTLTAPVPVNGGGFRIDPTKPATWKPAKKIEKDATNEVFRLLEDLGKVQAQVIGVELYCAAGQRYTDFSSDQLPLTTSTIRDIAKTLQGLVNETSNLTIEVTALSFERGQDLIDLVAAWHANPQASEVRQ